VDAVAALDRLEELAALEGPALDDEVREAILEALEDPARLLALARAYPALGWAARQELGERWLERIRHCLDQGQPQRAPKEAPLWLRAQMLATVEALDRPLDPGWDLSGLRRCAQSLPPHTVDWFEPPEIQAEELTTTWSLPGRY
jgi:hypothetical protein